MELKIKLVLILVFQITVSLSSDINRSIVSVASTGSNRTDSYSYERSLYLFLNSLHLDRGEMPEVTSLFIELFPVEPNVLDLSLVNNANANHLFINESNSKDCCYFCQSCQII